MSFGFPARAGGISARVLQKRLLPVAVAALCIYIVLNRLGEVDLSRVTSTLAAVTPIQWAAAILASAASFLAVGQYDALFHRWLGTGVASQRAVQSGASAIALAQTLGMGLATGTLARWRALPELSLSTALKVTNYVSFSFMAGLGILSLLVLALPGVGDIGASGFSLAALAVVVVATLFSFAQPRWLPFPMPPLRMALRLMILVAADVALAALAFWVLFPADLQPHFPQLLAVFTLALGAGLLSGSPGGVGPFELCLITLLPGFPEPELIAAILAFRLVYYALPACLALCLLARPRAASETEGSRALPPDFARAEAHLADQKGHRLLTSPDGQTLHVGEASQMLVAIGDPVCRGVLTKPALDALCRDADRVSRWPALYKCSARSAALARSQGWTVALLSEEALLNPGGFSLEGSNRRQLRRKLKRAEKSGVSVERAGALPMVEMTEIATGWAARAGGERGFSMGRFSEPHLARQRVYLARLDGRLLAFASFHVSDGEWTLDLMRSGAEMPDGTMHALIHAALLDAADLKVPRLSLAAMPPADPSRAMDWINRLCDGNGLRQFKQSFAPRAEPLYAAAPNAALLALAATDILLRIRYPDGL